MRARVCIWLVSVLAGCNAVQLRRSILAQRFERAGLESKRVALPSGVMRYHEGGTGSPVLLVEGFAFGALENWVEQAELTRRYRVIAPDLYWLGASVPNSPVQSVRTQAAALAELLDHLGEQQADLVGASYGGQIALRLALEHPERVRRLVIVGSTGLQPTPAEHSAVAARFGATSTEDLLLPPDVATMKRFLKALLHRPMWIPDFALPDILDEFHRNHDHKVEICRTMAKEAFTDEELAKIDKPTLVLWGRHDPILLLTMGERLTRALPHAELIVFEGSGHSPMLEEPARFNETVRAFLSRP